MKRTHKTMNSQKPNQHYTLSDFPHRTYDKIRYGDTDRQGHINNAMFVRFYETSRAEVLYEPKNELHDEDGSFVIANLTVEFLKEIHWPGQVEIGLKVTRLGNSSVTFLQALFQNHELVSTSTSVIVHVNNNTKKSAPLNDYARKYLASLQ